MSVYPVRPVPANFKDAHINAERYKAMYRQSLDDPDSFWAEMADTFLSWDQTWNRVVHYDFIKGETEWFGGGKLNASYNCIDRHLPQRAQQTALLWEGDDPADAGAHHGADANGINLGRASIGPRLAGSEESGLLGTVEAACLDPVHYLSRTHGQDAAEAYR